MQKSITSRRLLDNIFISNTHFPLRSKPLLNSSSMTGFHGLISCVCLLTVCLTVSSLDIKKNIFNTFKKDKADALGDLKKCRVSHSGVEYEGNIAQTKSGILCQNWETPNPIHKIAEQIADSDFPEGRVPK